MGNVLRIDSSSRTQGSQSRLLGDHFEKLWLTRHNHDVITRRDLVFQPIPPIANETIVGFYTPADQLTPELQAATALSDELIKELMAANTILLTIPMYNFTVPSAFKAWVDQIVRIGHTFSYDGKSFTGLVTERQAYVFCSYGAGGYIGGAQRGKLGRSPRPEIPESRLRFG